MTRAQIVERVCKRLNLTSDDARERIGDTLQTRYQWLTSSIGLITSRRGVVNLTINALDPVSWPSLPDVLIPNMVKINRVTTVGNSEPPTNAGGIIVLHEKTYDEIANMPTLTRLPRMFAVKLMGSNSVTITLDSFPNLPLPPATTPSFPLTVEGYLDSLILQDGDEPYFPADFHDLLVEGVMSDELRKMEKPQLAQLAEQKYEARLSDLRMFIAKSAYKDIAQGKDRASQTWYRNWNSRIGDFD